MARAFSRYSARSDALKSLRTTAPPPPNRDRARGSQTRRAHTVSTYEHVAGSATAATKTFRPAPAAGAFAQHAKRTVARRFVDAAPARAPAHRSPSAKTCSLAFCLARAPDSDAENVPSVVSWRRSPSWTAHAAWNCFTHRRWHHS